MGIWARFDQIRWSLSWRHLEIELVCPRWFEAMDSFWPNRRPPSSAYWVLSQYMGRKNDVGMGAFREISDLSISHNKRCKLILRFLRVRIQELRWGPAGGMRGRRRHLSCWINGCVGYLDMHWHVWPCRVHERGCLAFHCPNLTNLPLSKSWQLAVLRY